MAIEVDQIIGGKFTPAMVTLIKQLHKVIHESPTKSDEDLRVVLTMVADYLQAIGKPMIAIVDTFGDDDSRELYKIMCKQTDEDDPLLKDLTAPKDVVTH